MGFFDRTNEITRLHEAVAERAAVVDGLREDVLALRSELAELRAGMARLRGSDEPTVSGLPHVVREAIDRVMPPWVEDRHAQRVRASVLRGARVRLRAGQSDVEVAEWVDRGEDT